jgi:hypothetical protein
MSKKKDEPEFTAQEIALRRDVALKFMLNPNPVPKLPKQVKVSKSRKNHPKLEPEEKPRLKPTGKPKIEN